MFLYARQKIAVNESPPIYNKKAFTIIELLVTISIISLLLAIILPSLRITREQAGILTVNAELYGISVALESYGLDNQGKFPPTRADCNPSARRHAYALPQELIDTGCLPGGEIGKIRFAKIEDKFNRGCAYKYIAPGPVYDYHGTPFGNQRLLIPQGYPDSTDSKLNEYTNPASSPVSWVIFSLGPRYDLQSLETRSFPINKGFPMVKDFWYNPKERKGIITRVRLKKTTQNIGTFQDDN